MSFKTVQPGDPVWLKDAFSHLGLAEIPGVDHNPAILSIFAEIGHPEVIDDETSWCAAFVNWLLQRAGLPTTGELTARSFLGWGDPAGRPARGDVVVIKRGNSTWQGHVFLWLAEEGDVVWGIGGNQGKVGAVTVAKFPKSAVLGVRRPVAVAATAPPKARPGASGDRDLVRAVQQALWDKGYKQVGMIDGDYGRDTRAAIVAFELDNSLPVAGEPTIEILAQILAAAAKPVAAVRADASPADVREAVPEAKATWQAKVGAFWGMIVSAVTVAFGAVSQFFGFALGNLGDAKQLVQGPLDLFGDVPWWAYVGIVGAGLLFLWLRTRSAEQHQVDAFRSGERR